jgi:Methyltransferase domain
MKKRLRKLLHAIFLAGQRLGFDFLPRHFYSGIPDLGELSRNSDWKKPSKMDGVAGVDLAGQIRFAKDCCTPELAAMAQANGVHQKACEENGAEGYGRAEADFLFCFIAQKRPAKIIQIGAGVATSVMLNAASVAGYEPSIVCIDPYPTAHLERLSANGEIRLVREPAQTTTENLIDLKAGDLLFIDSTHTVKPGSEVNLIILNILPNLPRGCYVHFHDINFPFDYQSNIMNAVWFWNEGPLLHAFLIHNSRYRIVVSLSMLHYGRPAELEALLPGYHPAEMDHGTRVSTEHSFVKHDPSSIFLEVVA